MTTYFQNLTVNFNSYVGIKQPDMTDKDRFYKIYSPKKIQTQTKRRHLRRFKIQHSNA